ncbi:hypothetical protein H6761_00095 [Candidatus Nomurabacteria bacterium]|nr:hypothetical protein [Candidatus Nomurabacteria bacterium]
MAEDLVTQAFEMEQRLFRMWFLLLSVECNHQKGIAMKREECVHCDLVPIKVAPWQRLVVGLLFAKRVTVSFNGMLGHLLSDVGADDCCLFQLAHNGERLLVPMDTILLPRHISDLFLDQVKDLIAA